MKQLNIKKRNIAVARKVPSHSRNGITHLHMNHWTQQPTTTPNTPLIL